MVRDRIVCGITSQEIREKLLQSGDQLTMEKDIEIVVTHEATKQQLATMLTEGTIEVIKKRRFDSSSRDRRPPPRQNNDEYDCNNCGQRHGRRACPAYGKRCSNSTKPNHFAKVCRSRRPTKTVHDIEEHDEEDDSFLNIDVIAIGKDHPDTAYANITLDTGDVLRFKVDTGAQANVIPYQIYKRMLVQPHSNKERPASTGMRVSVLTSRESCRSNVPTRIGNTKARSTSLRQPATLSLSSDSRRPSSYRSSR
ncbi:hypothetical protein V1264_020300 [Littorina saxatilis]|uniref:Uncharacterized protein n=1 Tax=Littorina saxatilis TaxID=31220 RepID=A0AAN9BBF9_9CAEN